MKKFIKYIILFIVQRLSSALLLRFEHPSSELTISSLEEALLLLDNPISDHHRRVEISWNGEQQLSNAWNIEGNITFNTSDNETISTLNISTKDSYLVIKGSLTIKNIKIIFSKNFFGHEHFIFLLEDSSLSLLVRIYFYFFSKFKLVLILD
jgi:hypothetical protein